MKKKYLLGCLVAFFLAFTGCQKEFGDEEVNGGEEINGISNRMPGSGTLTVQYYDSPLIEGYMNLIDNDVLTKYLTFHSTVWLQWKGNSSKKVTKYSITSANDYPEWDPKSWSLWGSNNGTGWTYLTGKSDQSFSERFQKRTYTFSNSKYYTYYRLEITANNGGGNTQLSEWELGEPSSAENMDDLIPLLRDYTGSNQTTMGIYYENRHVTTASDRTWLAKASNQPPIPSPYNSNHQLKTFPVTLYPYGTPIPADINQGWGDCGVLSAIASICYQSSSFIQNLIKDNGNGTYNVAMYDPQGVAVTVVVDSKFIADMNGNLDLVVRGKNNVVCWSTILEKAIMKWNAIYHCNDNIVGMGQEHTAPLFTGDGRSFAFGTGVLTSTQLARAVRVSLRTGKFVVGGFYPGGTYGNYYVYDMHAYAAMITANSSALYDFRNPWGHSPLVGGGVETDRDGLVTISSGAITNIIDLRIIYPGTVGTAGRTTPYTPPSGLKSMAIQRVSDPHYFQK